MEQLTDNFVLKTFRDPMYIYRELYWEMEEIEDCYEAGEDYTYHLAEIHIFLTNYFESIKTNPTEYVKQHKK